MNGVGYQSRTAAHGHRVDRNEPVVWGDSTRGPWSVDEFASYERNGFVVREELLTNEEVAALAAELDRLLLRPDRDERYILEPDSDTVRSIFEIHRLSQGVAALARDERILGPVETILGSRAYIHQSRVNFKPALRGREFYWHSDFETWHHEDGMPAMRAVSVSIGLTDNTPLNGSLMLIPGSHRVFVGCVGETPDDHYRESLRAQNVGTPSDDDVVELAARFGIGQATGPAGSVIFFDSNCLHGSNGNITPWPRRNIFLVFNSVDNGLVEPFAGTKPRPDFIAARSISPLSRHSD